MGTLDGKSVRCASGLGARAGHNPVARNCGVDQYTGYDPQTDSYDNWHPTLIGEEKMPNRWFLHLQ
jgi:hypothetical protein